MSVALIEQSDWIETEAMGVAGYANGTRWLPRCSAVLDVLFPTAMRYVDTAALERGTRLHQAAQDGLRSGKWNVAALSDADRPAIEGLHKWIRTWVKRTIAVEKVLLSDRHGYASRIDCAVQMKSGAVVMPDWKFSESHNFRFEYQAEAHRHLDFAEPTQVWIVSVDSTGTVRVRKHQENAHQWHRFLAALTVLKCRMEHGG